MKPERRWTSRLLLRGIRQSGFARGVFVAGVLLLWADLSIAGAPDC